MPDTLVFMHGLNKSIGHYHVTLPDTLVFMHGFNKSIGHYHVTLPDTLVFMHGFNKKYRALSRNTARYFSVYAWV